MKMECIICLETDAKKISVASQTLDSFLKLLEQFGQRAQYMDNSVDNELTSSLRKMGHTY